MQGPPCASTAPSTVPKRDYWLFHKAVCLSGSFFQFGGGFFFHYWKRKPLVWVFLYLADYHTEPVFPALLWEVGAPLTEGRACLASQHVRQRSIDPKGTGCGWAGEKLSWECSQQDPPLARDAKQVQNSFTKVFPQKRTWSHLTVLFIHASHTIWKKLIALIDLF